MAGAAGWISEMWLGLPAFEDDHMPLRHTRQTLQCPARQTVCDDDIYGLEHILHV